MSLRVAMVVDRFPQEPFLARLVSGLLERGLDLHVLCQVHDRRSPVWSTLDRSMLHGRIHSWAERRQPVRLAAAAAGVLGRSLVRRPSLLALAARREVAAGAETAYRPGLLGRVLFDARVLDVGPDVVHFQFGDLARRRTHLAQAVECGFSSSFRGYDLAYAGLDETGYYDRLWPELDGGHTLGHDLRRLAVARGCPTDFDWTVIPPAVDTDRFTPPARPRTGGPLEIISVGRLHWKKGYTDALVAISGLQDAGVDLRYRILGSGHDEEMLRWQIRDLDLETVVELAGPVAPDQVPAELAKADVFLHPALTEGFGNAVLEAQAAGLPVVCTDAEGLAENVLDGETGFVVPRRRPSLLQQRLADLAGDPILRREMGRTGRLRVIECFSPERQIDAYIDFYRQVAQRHRSRWA